MRLLLITHGLPPEGLGGVEQHVEMLARNLAQRGHQVVVLARSSTGQRPHAIERTRAGNPDHWQLCYRWDALRTLDDVYEQPQNAAAVAAWLAARQAADGPFDAAHIHHLTGLCTTLPRVLAAAGVRVALTLHDYWLICPRGQMFHRDGQPCATTETARCGDCVEHTFGELVPAGSGASTVQRLHERARAALASVHAWIAPSRAALAPFASFGVDERRCHVVPSAIDAGALAALPLPACGPGPLRIGYLGTVIPSKGLHVLVEAVQQQPPGTVELQIHGNSVPYHGDTGYLARVLTGLRPADRIRYCGPFLAADLPRLLAGIDLLGAPSLWHETFGMTVREALAAGRPVLVSKVGGLQDAVTDGREGCILGAGDVAAWAAAIRTLATDRPRLRAMAARARDRAVPAEGMVEQLLGIYTRLGRQQA